VPGVMQLESNGFSGTCSPLRRISAIVCMHEDGRVQEGRGVLLLPDMVNGKRHWMQRRHQLENPVEV
jgi:hypothetical protein